MTNRLYYGDNLEVMRDQRDFPDACVDLIYLDPPFNSNAGYNVLFKSASGAGADASIEAFDDTWTWGDASRSALMDIDSGTNRSLQVMMRAMHDALGDSPLMAYLAMMAVRLVELHRVLKDTGSLYLHCDPTASHYLKLVLDAVFGAENFRSEVIWRRTFSHNSARRWGPVHDTIFFYSRSPAYQWAGAHEDLDDAYIRKFYRFEDERGRYQVDNLTGAGTRTGESGLPWRSINPTEAGRHWAVPKSIIKRMGINGAYDTMSVQQKLDYLDSVGLIAWPEKGVMPRFKRYLEFGLGAAV